MDLRLNSIGIDPTRRAETLALEEFCAIANMIDSATDG
jgi:16S rRNA A1518/A1519 N6-dimethyltransferase RsmA/KsgA/DIM1 with predicted DNA glycosylase/AP lyase activity